MVDIIAGERVWVADAPYSVQSIGQCPLLQGVHAFWPSGLRFSALCQAVGYKYTNSAKIKGFWWVVEWVAYYFERLFA